MKRMFFKNIYCLIFDTVIWLVIYCFFTNKIMIYLLLANILLHLIHIGMELYEFKLNKDIKKLNDEVFNEKRNK